MMNFNYIHQIYRKLNIGEIPQINLSNRLDESKPLRLKKTRLYKIMMTVSKIERTTRTI